MVYIIEISSPDIEIDITTAMYLYYDSLKQAISIGRQYKSCHGSEIDVKIYEAINEYTNKRKLVKIID